MYDYGNARIRGLRSHLIRPQELHALAGRHDVGDLIAALAPTDYGSDLEQGRVGLSGLPLLEGALQHNLSRRMRALPNFFEEPERSLVRGLLAPYDLANLVALLRARATGAPQEEVMGALLPAGELDGDQLVQLAGTPDLGQWIALLRRWDSPHVCALAGALPAFQDGGRLTALEVALWRGFLGWAMAQSSAHGANGALVREALALRVDAGNLLQVFRLWYGDIHPDAESLGTLLAAGGSLPVQEWGRHLGQPPREVLAALLRTALGRALAAWEPLGLDLDEGLQLEWTIERYVTRWAQAQVYRDPLGIGLTLAYHAAKVEEVRHLRLIGRALAASWPVGRLDSLLTGNHLAGRERGRPVG